jgi:anti-sigma regulatory factor (Ser/Thr protein kinase)
MSGRDTRTQRSRQDHERHGGHGSSPGRRGEDPVARELEFTIDDLGRVRSLVADAAARTSLGGERGEDLVLAVNELATNSICHGGGHGTLRLWCSGDALQCEIRDAGHIPAAASVLGRDRPDPDAMSGRGLWLVDQLCDAVHIASSPGTGSTVRVGMRLS